MCSPMRVIILSTSAFMHAEQLGVRRTDRHKVWSRLPSNSQRPHKLWMPRNADFNWGAMLLKLKLFRTRICCFACLTCPVFLTGLGKAILTRGAHATDSRALQSRRVAAGLQLPVCPRRVGLGCRLHAFTESREVQEYIAKPGGR